MWNTAHLSFDGLPLGHAIAIGDKRGTDRGTDVRQLGGGLMQRQARQAPLLQGGRGEPHSGRETRQATGRSRRRRRGKAVTGSSEAGEGLRDRRDDIRGPPHPGSALPPCHPVRQRPGTL